MHSARISRLAAQLVPLGRWWLRVDPSPTGMGGLAQHCSPLPSLSLADSAGPITEEYASRRLVHAGARKQQSCTLSCVPLTASESCVVQGPAGLGSSTQILRMIVDAWIGLHGGMPFPIGQGGRYVLSPTVGSEDEDVVLLWGRTTLQALSLLRLKASPSYLTCPRAWSHEPIVVSQFTTHRH